MKQKEELIELILICDNQSDVLSCFRERPRLRQVAEIIADHLLAAEIIADHLLANGVVVLPCRCCECEHCDIGQNDVEQWCVCQVKRIDVDPTDFCSYGKRKGDLPKK